MARYVDGFVIPIPKKNLKAYQKMANEAGKIWKKYGALEYFECVGEDLNPDMGGIKLPNFPKMARLKSGETVLFSFIVFKSRAQRDKVNAKVREEMDKMYKDKPMPIPFDMKRFAYGGFNVIVDL